MLAIEWAPQAVVASTPVRPRRITPAHHWRVANSEHSAQLELPRRVGGSSPPRPTTTSGDPIIGRPSAGGDAHWRPFAKRCGVVIDDVVDAGSFVLEGKDGGPGGVARPRHSSEP
jgi:hypothetical protein